MKKCLCFLICLILISTLLFGECAKFKIAYKDSKGKKLKEYRAVKKSTRVQCAAHCLQRDDCNGFSLDSSNTCRLLKGKIEEGSCPGSECVDKEGYSVYMMQAEE